MRWTFGRTSALLAALVALSVLAACGDDGEGTPETIDSRDDTTAAPAGGPEDGGGEGQGQGQGQGDDDEDDEGHDDQGDGDDGGDDDDQGDGGDGVRLTSSGDHDCTDGQDVQVGGTDLGIDITGACGAVTVGGNGNVVTIAEAASVKIEGAGHDIDITGSTATIALSGAGHQVAYTGDPEVTDDSAGSTVG